MRKTLIAALTIAAALLGVSCQHRIVSHGLTLPGFYGFFLFSYTLNQCPADAYQLPHRRSGKDTGIEAGYLDGPYCHGFTKYELSTKHGFFWNQTSPIYVRLQTGAPCSVFVAVPTDRMCTGQTLAQCTSYRTARNLASLSLDMLFEDSPLRPRAATLNANGFPANRDFEQWCGERIRNKFNATSHPVFKIVPPEINEPNVD